MIENEINLITLGINGEDLLEIGLDAICSIALRAVEAPEEATPDEIQILARYVLAVI